jgi:hypothetical protein
MIGVVVAGGGGGGGEVESSDSTLLCGLPSFEMFDGRGQHPLSLIPATLPTLVGDLALATTPPHHTKPSYQVGLSLFITS